MTDHWTFARKFSVSNLGLKISYDYSCLNGEKLKQTKINQMEKGVITLKARFESHLLRCYIHVVNICNIKMIIKKCKYIHNTSKFIK